MVVIVTDELCRRFIERNIRLSGSLRAADNVLRDDERELVERRPREEVYLTVVLPVEERVVRLRWC